MTTESRQPGDEPPLTKRPTLGDRLTSEKLEDQLLDGSRSVESGS